MRIASIANSPPLPPICDEVNGETATPSGHAIDRFRVLLEGYAVREMAEFEWLILWISAEPGPVPNAPAIR
jgi:hypothetical protein